MDISSVGKEMKARICPKDEKNCPVFHHEVPQSFWFFINATAQPFGRYRYERSPPSNTYLLPPFSTYF